MPEIIEFSNQLCYAPHTSLSDNENHFWLNPLIALNGKAIIDL
jgi:hypothetical protein